MGLSLALAVATVLLVAVVATGRLLARRAELGTRLELLGSVPEVGTWLPPALQAASAASPWAWELYPIATGPWATRAEMSSPTGDGLVVVRVDSSQPSGAFSAADPVRVTVTTAGTTAPTGLAGALFGVALTPVGRMRARVATQIRRQTAAAPGLFSRPVVREQRRTRLLVAAAVVAALVAGGAVLAARGDLADLGRTVAGVPLTTPAPTKSTRPAKPKGATTACRVEHQLASGPSYSAVNAEARCGFAENVRRAYGQQDAAGAKVRLTKIRDPQADKSFAVTCENSTPVVCRGGSAKAGVVYLYG